MKIIISIFFIALASLLLACKKKSSTGMVYICTESKHNTYHKNKNCDNLKKCDKDILYVPFTNKEDDKKGKVWYYNIPERSECGLCYGE